MPQNTFRMQIGDKAQQLEERARRLAFEEGMVKSRTEYCLFYVPFQVCASLDETTKGLFSTCITDQELKRGSALSIIPPSPVKKQQQSPAVAAAKQAVISTLRQHTAPAVELAPVLVPTMPLAANYLHQQQFNKSVNLVPGEKEKDDSREGSMSVSDNTISEDEDSGEK